MVDKEFYREILGLKHLLEWIKSDFNIPRKDKLTLKTKCLDALKAIEKAQRNQEYSFEIFQMIAGSSNRLQHEYFDLATKHKPEENECPWDNKDIGTRRKGESHVNWFYRIESAIIGEKTTNNYTDNYLRALMEGKDKIEKSMADKICY